MATEIKPQKPESGIKLTERTVSRDEATLEVKLIEIPRSVQQGITRGLQQGRETASKAARKSK